jgi:hypothetical protein
MVEQKSLFYKVSSDSIKNILYFVIVAFVIQFIVNSLEWRMIGLIFAGIFLVITFLSLVSFLILFVTSLLMIPNTIQEMRYGNNQILVDEMWIWGGIVIRLMEELVCIFLVFKLYNLFF